MSFSSQDEWHMRACLNLARTGLGRVWPNPSVGCVIVKGDIIVGRARTADGGRPHAETIALEQASDQARGAAVYVSLEPCAHHGKTGPCAQALIDAGVSRVVIACLDNDERVSGKGAVLIKEAGISVEVGLFEKEALAINQGFFLKNAQNRPLVTLKTATTLDSKIADAGGHSKWITGKQARGYGHIERAQHDAIMVGMNSVLSDNPSLNARIDGVEHRGVRIVLDTHLKIKGDEKLFDNIEQNPLWVITSRAEDEASMLLDKGAEILTVSQNADGQINLNEALKALAEKGITRLLVEGGAQLVTSFLKEGLFDRLLWFHSASLIGSNAYNAIQETGISHLKEKINLLPVERRILAEDMLDIYEKAS